MNRRHSSATPVDDRLALRALFLFSLRQLVRSRRTFLLALVALVPVGLSVLAVIFHARGLFPLGDRYDLFPILVVTIFIQFLVQLYCLLYGTSLFADEVEGQTTFCLFTRPIRRELILLVRFAAMIFMVALFLFPALLSTYGILAWGAGGFRGFSILIQDMAVLVLAMVVYGALFLFLGLAVRRPVLTGLFFFFGWESIMSSLPGYAKNLTVLYYLRSLLPHTVVPDDMMFFFAQPCSVQTALTVLGGLILLFLILSMQLIRTRDWAGAAPE